MSHGTTTLLLGIAVMASCGGTGGESADRTVDLGTHSLHAVVIGTGAPAVVIDGGIGAGSDAYRRLQDRIATMTTVVTYDRAGYGASEVGPVPRDSRREAQELRTLLTKLNVPRPYVLVGHSLGGLNSQVYAHDHPEDVAGLVLLDPPPLAFILGEEYAELAAMADRMTDEWQRIADAGLRSEDADERSDAGRMLMLASEHREMFGNSARQASSIATFDDLSVVVIASGVPNPMFGDVAESYQRFWATESEAIAAKSSRGTYVFAEASTHQLHLDAEDLVADRVLSMVRSVRDP